MSFYYRFANSYVMFSAPQHEGSLLSFVLNILQPGTCRALMQNGGYDMLWYAWVFLVIAIIAAIFGFGGIAAGAAGIAKILFFVFLVVFLISLITGRRTVV